MATVKDLVEMGFEEVAAKMALDHTGNGTMEQAINWILENPAKIAKGPTQSSTTAQDSAQGSSSASTEENSLAYKCDDCGKVFFNAQKVEFHAVRSGHTNFSESDQEGKPVPLTEEEKKQKLKELQERIKVRRAAKEKEEELEKFEAEKARIASGKNMAEVKKRLQDAEMKKALEERKREKQRTKDAQDRVMRLLEEDKERRRQSNNKDNKEQPKEEKPPAQEPAPKQPTKEYTDCRIQFRLPSGPPVVQTFSAREPLSAARCWVRVNHPPRAPKTQIGLSTAYPRRTFQEDQMEMPLDSLGLVPASVLVVTYQ